MIEFPGLQVIWAALPEARVVGGAVRDTLAGARVTDVDFASPLTPEVVMARLSDAGVKVLPTGLAHGTVTAVVRDRRFEITTLRQDVRTDGRHAVVAFTDDWAADASRRDFTINAMSVNRLGEIFDYFGGKRDLAEGRVRFVGAARARIAEDYLRIFRFFRFFAWYGKGDADAEAVEAIKLLREGTVCLAAERVWGEVKRILAAGDPMPTVLLMRETGVLGDFISEPDVRRLERMLKAGAPVDVLLRVAALLRVDVEGFAARWRLSGDEYEKLAAFLGPNVLDPVSNDDDLRRVLADTPPEVLLARTWLAEHAEPCWPELRARIAAMARPIFPLTGGDLVALGVAPGPAVGELLRDVRAWWMRDGCLAGAEACLDEARKHLFFEKKKQKTFVDLDHAGKPTSGSN